MQYAEFLGLVRDAGIVCATLTSLVACLQSISNGLKLKAQVVETASIKAQVVEVHLSVNSRMDALLEATKQLQFAAGRLEGQKQGKSDALELISLPTQSATLPHPTVPIPVQIIASTPVPVSIMAGSPNAHDTMYHE